MRGQVPYLARVELETITPLHIGAGQGGGKAFDDECLGERPIPKEYRPPPRRGGVPEVVKLHRSQRDRKGTPYVPASTLRGFLRGLYTGALEASGVHRAEDAADEIFGSTEQAGAIALNDLLPEGPVRTFSTELLRYLRATEAAGGQRGGSRQNFPVELVDAGATFSGQALYVGDTLPDVLTTIFAQAATLTDWLRTGRRGQPNPETVIPGSPINGTLFQHQDDRWTITWKLGRYAKSYAKALSTQRRLQSGGTPHAYYLVQDTDEVPGWVRITFDLAPPNAEFRLNEWPEEEA